MTITDRIYGSFSVISPVLLELINSPPLARLKDISQMGPPTKYYHITNYSRYEHSIGVMLLLIHLNASLEEQIAGLLHDVSHTAFSHVIDWVVGSGKVENFQDNQHERFILNTEIPIILKKHGFSVDTILDYKRFALLEQGIPKLCADRVDYALREIPVKNAQSCYSQLTSFHNHIAFLNETSAYDFAHEFIVRQQEHWGGYEAVTRYNLFASLLKRALKLKIISMEDFQGTESPIMTTLENSKDVKIRTLLETLMKKDVSDLARDSQVTHKKFRYVDPYVIVGNKLVPLTKINVNFKAEIDRAQQENGKGVRSGTI